MGIRLSKVGGDVGTMPSPVYEKKGRRLVAMPDELIEEARTDIKSLRLSTNFIEEITDEISLLVGLRHVDVSHNRLSLVAYQFFELPQLTHANMSGNNLTGLPGLESAKKLLHLDISKNKFRKLHAGFFKLRRLQHLLAADNKLSSLPNEFARLESLKSLDLRRNPLGTVRELVLPPSLITLKLGAKGSTLLAPILPSSLTEGLKSLEHLDLSNNLLDKNITDEDKGILHAVLLLTGLVYLNVEGNCIKALPGAFSNLTSLTTCILSNNSIQLLPAASLEGLRRLEIFRIDKNKIQDVDAIPFDDMRLAVLSMNDNMICRLPEQIAMPTLETLHLDCNRLPEINHVSFHKMKKLKSLSLKKNCLTEIPSAICQARCLETFDIEGNQINNLPSGFYFPHLEKLNLGSNRLRRVPECLSEMKTLKDVNLEGNPFEDEDSSQGVNSEGNSFEDGSLSSGTSTTSVEVAEDGEDSVSPEEEQAEDPAVTEIPKKRGRIFILGANGAGKATTIRNLQAMVVDGHESRPAGSLRSDQRPVSVPEDEPSETNGADKEVAKPLSFMDCVNLPLDHDLDIELVYCGGRGMAHLACPLFYTDSTLYAIIVNLAQYIISPDERFKDCIKVFIDGVLDSVGADVTFVVVGTCGDSLQLTEVEEVRKSIGNELKKCLTDWQQRKQTDSPALSSFPDVLVMGASEQQIDLCRHKMVELLRSGHNNLLPINSTDVCSQDKQAEMVNSQPSEELLREKLKDVHQQEVAITLLEFEDLLQQVGYLKEDAESLVVYLKRAGVLQHYAKIPNLKGHIFHNLDFLKDVLGEMFGREKENFLGSKIRSSTVNDDGSLSRLRKTFKSKAVVSADVIREYVLSSLDVSTEALSLVLDVLIGFGVCYQVHSGEESLSSLEMATDKPPTRVLRFPAFLSKVPRIPRKFKPVLETGIELQSWLSSAMLNTLACAYNSNIKAAWEDGFYGVFNGVTMTITEQKGLSKTSTLVVETAMDKRVRQRAEDVPGDELRAEMLTNTEHVFNVLNSGLLQRMRAIMKRKWPSVSYLTKLRVICPEGVGCEHPNSAMHHSRIPFPEDSSKVLEELNLCQYQQEAADHTVTRGMVNEACDLVCSKLEPGKWKELALQLGIPGRTVTVIDRRDGGCEKDKLRELVDRWKDKLHTPGVMMQQFQILINSLRVINEQALADTLSELQC